MSQKEKKGRGCFLGGCLIASLIIVFVVGVLAFGGWKAWQYFLENTDTEPLAIEMVAMDEAAAAEIGLRIESFKNAVDAGAEPAALELSADEVNGLIYSNEEFRDSGIGLEVSFEDGKASAHISLPLGDLLELEALQGRYLNGTGTLNVSGEEGVVLVTIDAFSVKGKPLSEVALQELRKENLAKGLYEDTESAAFAKRIKRLEIRGDRLFIEIYPEQKDPAGAE